MVLKIIIFEGLVFIGLILLLRHFMKEHVTGAVGHLQKLNDELMKQQAELKEKIAATEKDFETKMTKAQQEISARQAQSKQDATKTLEEARERAMQEREKLINEAVETREKMRQEIMAEMEDKAIHYSEELIAEFLTGDLRKLVHETLVRDVIDSIREVNMAQYQIQTDSVELITAEAVDADLRKKIKQLLQEKIKKEISIKEEMDSSLVGGLILRFGTFVIDGSLTNRLKEASARFKKETARRYQGKT